MGAVFGKTASNLLAPVPMLPTSSNPKIQFLNSIISPQGNKQGPGRAFGALTDPIDTTKQTLGG